MANGTKVEARRRAKRAGPDYGEWPTVGAVRAPKMRGALGGCADETLRNYVRAGLLPPPVRLGPNLVGWPVDTARAAIRHLIESGGAPQKRGRAAAKAKDA